MNESLRTLTELDRVIHEPARLLIVSILYLRREADFLFLQRESGLTKGNMSRHLSKLEDAGYVSVEKTYRGKVPLTLLRLTAKGESALKAYQDAIRKALPDQRP